MNLLFLRSRNRWRSPTAERLFHGVAGVLTRSAGTETGARSKVTAGHLGWADLVIVMEKKHPRRIREHYAEVLTGKRVVCLNIPVDYLFMQPELVAWLRTAAAPYLTD